MTKLSLVVKGKEETLTAKVEGLSDKEVVSLIREFIGSTPITATIERKDTVTTIAPLKKVEPVVTPVTKDADAYKISKAPEAKFEPVKTEETRSRKLPLLGSENRSSFSIGEALSKASMENTRMTEDGLRLFRTYSKCPHCGLEHTGRYVNAEQVYLKCFDCKGKITVEPATTETQIFEGKEIPKMSVDGFYFIAKKENIDPAEVF